MTTSQHLQEDHQRIRHGLCREAKKGLSWLPACRRYPEHMLVFSRSLASQELQGLTCRPQVDADSLMGRRGCRECPLTRANTAARINKLDISRTAAMRVLLRGLAAAGSVLPPAVAPRPMVPMVDTTTAPHSAACSRSCSTQTVGNTSLLPRHGKGWGNGIYRAHLQVEVGEHCQQDQS